MLFLKNEALREIILANERNPEESLRGYSSRLSMVSGGAISPEAFRRNLQRQAAPPREPGAKKLKKGKLDDGKVSIDESSKGMVWSYDGSANITNLQQALEFSKVDLNVWEVDRHVFNTWTTTSKEGQKWNVQVKVWFKRRADAGMNWDELLSGLPDIAKRPTKQASGSGIGFICTADFHLGAYVDDLIRSDKFNIEVLVEYLRASADIINSKKYKEVHVAMLGDFIESFTGLNHHNSWKGLGKGMFGMNAVILCSEILVESFLSKINNLSEVYMVSGNHDRVTSDKETDQKGEVGHLLHYLLSKSLSVRTTYHPMIVNAVVDGISYVMTHGHLPLSKRDMSKVLFDYGKQGMFNVLLTGHTHSRETTKSYKKKSLHWDDKVVVQMDEVDYRALTAPPMFTGNFFSEALGYSSSAGFLEIQNNGKGRINVFDYCL